MEIDLEEVLGSSFLNQEQKLASQQRQYDRDAEADKERWFARSNLVPTVDRDPPDVGFLVETLSLAHNNKLPHGVIFTILKYCVDVCPTSLRKETPQCSIWVSGPNVYCSWQCWEGDPDSDSPQNHITETYRQCQRWR
jgi:hypothetical protein